LKKVFLSLVTLALTAAACSPFAPPTAGSEAPGIELFDLNNQAVRLSDFLGRPVVINFWGTQCPYCLDEMSALEAAFREESAQTDGAAFLAVNVQDTAAGARNFMNSNGYTLPVLMDAGSKAAQAYNVSAIPVTFFIDRTGIIRYVKLGAFLSVNEVSAALNTIR